MRSTHPVRPHGIFGSDVDGDGDNDTYLEAQQLAAKELFEAYVAAGYDPSRVTITLVEYGSSGTVLGIFNLDDQAAFNAAVDGLDSSGSTNFEDPLQDIYGSWSSQGVDPTANNTVIFLSDGMQNSGGTFTDDASALSSTFGANISAIGVGVNSSLSQLNQMDNTGGAVKVTNVADILNEITSPPPILDVNSVTVELSYVDANNNPHTFSYTYDINNAPITPTPTGYNINGHEIDFNPLPLAGTNIDVTVTTSFNNGANSISTGIIAVPAYTCFSADVLIMTDRGEVRAGDLVAGDMVMTFDNGLQPLLWVGKRAVAPEMLRSLPKICPIRIKAGALGPIPLSAIWSCRRSTASLSPRPLPSACSAARKCWSRRSTCSILRGWNGRRTWKRSNTSTSPSSVTNSSSRTVPSAKACLPGSRR